MGEMADLLRDEELDRHLDFALHISKVKPTFIWWRKIIIS